MNPGDLIALGFQGILILRLLQKQDIPPIPSPLADVTYEGLMGPRRPLLRATPSLDVTGASPLPLTTASPTAVSCIACTKHHLAGVAAMLNEATRFTRSGTPISDPEVQERLAIAEEEIAAWERKDVTPAQIAASPPEERKLILDTVEKVRALRHFIDSSRLGMGKGTPEDLEQAAAMASQIRQEFRGHLVELGQEHAEAETPENPGNPGAENPSIKEALAGRQSMTFANLINAQGQQFRLMLSPDISERGTYSVVAKGPGGTQSFRMKYPSNYKLAEVKSDFEEYINIDAPADTSWKVELLAPAEPHPSAKPKTFEQDIRAQIKEREAKRFKSANDEIQIERLKATLAADPNRWQVGQGVGWKAVRGQVNRGYRIEAILPETKEAIIRPIGDIGQLADYTGQAQQVDIIDLLRDKKYDALPEELKSNPGHENPGSKELWQMTRDEYLKHSLLPRQQRIPETGNYTAIRTIDDGIYFEAERPGRIHADLIADLGAPEQVAGGGFIREGVYHETERSDSWRIGEQARATKRVGHRRQVAKALDEGKPVPAEVLADYPDLAAQYEKLHPEHPGHNPHG